MVLPGIGRLVRMKKEEEIGEEWERGYLFTNGWICKDDGEGVEE